MTITTGRTRASIATAEAAFRPFHSAGICCPFEDTTPFRRMRTVVGSALVTHTRSLVLGDNFAGF